jgi:putative hemolysin
MQHVLQKIPHVIRFKLNNRQIVTPSISIHIVRDRYIAKTADNFDEISQVLSLRHEVFYGEFSKKKLSSSIIPYDIDFYDFGCDHLIVKEKSSNQVIACYRLRSDNSGKKIKRFYSEGEFNIDDFLSSIGGKLELGRACVHKDYRKGTVISLLWAGVLEYAERSGARFMFGCSSVTRPDFDQLPSMIEWLHENNAFINDLKIDVHSKYKLPRNIKEIISSKDRKIASKKALNSLMHMYIVAGAKLSRNLAYDPDMDCIDFFTLIDLEAIPKSFKKKFAA